ncbi:hypothetical protein [Phascolarctobacterium succinatutens]|uniref:hypothetical protein n=1 Tax=Phascolarctobacterium succinatutens TaxID=626940 RepID=UPI0026E921F2|nr:hypothetical protein [Phascolarctobacterium succinatutens]
MNKDKKKSPAQQGIDWSILKLYFFSCIPFFSNEFLESLTFWDWLPLIISIASLTASIAAYCKH